MCTCIMCVVQSYGQRAAQIYGIDDSIQTMTSDQIWQAHGSHQRTRLRIYEDDGAQFTRAGIGPPRNNSVVPEDLKLIKMDHIGEMRTAHLADFMGFPTFPVISPDG